MATTVYYSATGKSLLDNWSNFFTFYWKDFNPNVPTRPATSQNQMTASWETSYDLADFQPGNEVCCCLFWFKNSGSDNVYVSWDMYFKKKVWSTYYSEWMWHTSGWASISSDGGWYMYYYYVWIDYDEIQSWYSNYRFEIEWSSTDWSTDTIYCPISVSNLSFDSSFHKPWYLWIEWEYLCYTDASYYGYQWYKHKINHDSYSWPIKDPWYIRIPSSSSDTRIYYTDAYGVTRRTHVASDRYSPTWTPNTWYVWTQYAGKMRVPTWDTEDGYWYLCYVDSGWYKRRMWNGTP